MAGTHRPTLVNPAGAGLRIGCRDCSWSEPAPARFDWRNVGEWPRVVAIHDAGHRPHPGQLVLL